MRFEIVGIALQNVLRFEHRVANATGLCVQLSQARGQVFGTGIGFNGGAIFLDRLGGQITAAINRHLLLVHVRQGVVVVGGSLIRFVRGRRINLLRVLWGAGGLRETGSSGHQKHENGERNISS